MRHEIYSAADRGQANHGWLKARHTFSFAGYNNPKRVHFGALRVLNDDVIDAGQGFPTHPHENMEIVTIPLEGQIAHKDSMGNGETLSVGEVQVMSAGTGIRHSEYNPNDNKKTALFQIWVFTKKKNREPDYGQRAFSSKDRQNRWQALVSPSGSNSRDKKQGALLIHQDAWFKRADFNADIDFTYKLEDPKSGVFLMVIDGSIEIKGQTLHKRDAIGLTKFADLPEFSAKSLKKTELLLIEVPMS